MLWPYYRSDNTVYHTTRAGIRRTSTGPDWYRSDAKTLAVSYLVAAGDSICFRSIISKELNIKPIILFYILKVFYMTDFLQRSYAFFYISDAVPDNTTIIGPKIGGAITARSHTWIRTASNN